jgi:dUTP pyrophosphatase
LTQIRFSASGYPFVISINAEGLDPHDHRVERVTDQVMTFLHECGYAAQHLEDAEDVELRQFEFQASLATLKDTGYPIPISVLRRSAHLASDEEVDALHGSILAPGIKVWARRDVLLPSRAHSGDSGMDLRADLFERDEDNEYTLMPVGSSAVSACVRVIAPGKRMKIPCGIHMAVPIGYEVQVRPRSGLADVHGITVLNSPGTIDWSYRGEVSVVLINHGEEDFIVEDCMRIAQAVVAPVVTVNPEAVRSKADLGETARGDRGYGSTGFE